MSKLREEIAAAINRNSAENGSNTPDYILAEFLEDCLRSFDKALQQRDAWYGNAPVVPQAPPVVCEINPLLRPGSMRNPKESKRPAKESWCPGEYFNKCCQCNQYFIGDKRAMNCADCAYAVKEGQ